MSQTNSDSLTGSETPQIEYATPVARPVGRTLAIVLILFTGVILVCVGGFFLFCILRLARDPPSDGMVFFAGLLGMFAGIALCGAGVTFYVGTRALLKVTGMQY